MKTIFLIPKRVIILSPTKYTVNDEGEIILEYRRQRVYPSKVYPKGRSRNYKSYRYKSPENHSISGKFIIALFVFLAIFIINSIDSPIPNKIIDGVRVVITRDFDIKKSFGRIKFIQKHFPKAKAVFGFDTDEEARVLYSFIVPAEGRIISSFAETGGLDIEGDGELDILCAADGEVILVDSHAQGYAITISHEANLVTVYHNITQPYVKKGQRLQQGTIIGRIADTHGGEPVLHFKVWKDDEPVDPVPYFPK